MSEAEQISAFMKDLDQLIERYRHEFDLRVATAIGCLEMTKLALFHDEVDRDE